MSVRTAIRQLGLVDGLLYLTGRALQRASGGRANLVKYRLVAQRIGGPAAVAMRPDPVTQMLPVRAGDPLEVAFPRPPEVLARRWAAGARCTVALVRDEFAGFIWIQRGAYDEDEVRCRYVLDDPRACVWDYDVYVEPKYRLGRTMARLWSHVDAGLAAEGVRWSCSRISAFNAASLASHARLGLAPLGSALFLVLGPLQLAWLPGRWWPAASLSEAGAPVLRVPSPDAQSVRKSAPAAPGAAGPRA